MRPHNGETWQFVCTSCGYLEWWVIDEETTRYLEEKWVAVPPQE